MINGLSGSFRPPVAPQKQQGERVAEQRPADNQTANHAEQMMDVMDDMAMVLSQFNRRQYGKKSISVSYRHRSRKTAWGARRQNWIGL